MATMRIKRGDTRPVQGILKTNGQRLNLAGAPAPAVRFLMQPKPGSGGASVAAVAAILQGIDGDGNITNKGLVEWTPTEGDVDAVGVHDQEWEVTWANGTIETFPQHGYNAVVIEADLG